MNNKKDWKKIISIFVFFSFIVPIGYLVYKIATTTNEIIPNTQDIRVRSDYVLMLIQCFLGIFAMGLPSIISKKFKLEIPNTVFYFYLLFLYSAIFLGEVQNFYNKYSFWDLLLHILSGGMIGFIGFSIVDILNTDNQYVNLKPFFVAFFAFCFALALGAIWEIYEYICDGFFSTNMQKYILESGTKLIGRDALADTMEDIIVDGLGALVTSIIGYISIKYDKDYLKHVLIKFKKDKKDKKNIKHN